MKFKLIPLHCLVFLFTAFVLQSLLTVPSHATDFTLDDLTIDSPPESTIIISGDREVRREALINGYADALPEVYAAIDSARPGETIAVCPGAYERFIVPAGTRDISIIGQDATIVTFDEYLNVIEIYDCSNILIKNFEIYHDVEFTCMEGCIKLCGSDNIKITDCDIHGSGSFGVSVDYCSEIEITYNIIHDCTWAGVLVDAWGECDNKPGYSENIIVEDNFFYSNFMDLDDSMYYGQSLAYFFEMNNFYNPELTAPEYFDLSTIEGDYYPEDMICVTKNPDTREEAWMYDFKGVYPDIQSAIENCDMYDTIIVTPGRYAPFYMYEGVSDITIEGYDARIVAENEWDNLIYIYGATGITINGFHMYHEVPTEIACAGQCIYMFDATDITITNCDIEGSGSYGIEFNCCDSIYLYYNMIHGCTFGAINVADWCDEYNEHLTTTNVVMEGNWIWDNPEDVVGTDSFDWLQGNFYKENYFGPPEY